MTPAFDVRTTLDTSPLQNLKLDYLESARTNLRDRYEILDQTLNLRDLKAGTCILHSGIVYLVISDHPSTSAKPCYIVQRDFRGELSLSSFDDSGLARLVDDQVRIVREIKDPIKTLNDSPFVDLAKRKSELSLLCSDRIEVAMKMAVLNNAQVLIDLNTRDLDGSSLSIKGIPIQLNESSYHLVAPVSGLKKGSVHKQDLSEYVQFYYSNRELFDRDRVALAGPIYSSNSHMWKLLDVLKLSCHLSNFVYRAMVVNDFEELQKAESQTMLIWTENDRFGTSLGTCLRVGEKHLARSLFQYELKEPINYYGVFFNRIDCEYSNSAIQGEFGEREPYLKLWLYNDSPGGSGLHALSDVERSPILEDKSINLLTHDVLSIVNKKMLERVAHSKKRAVIRHDLLQISCYLQ